MASMRDIKRRRSSIQSTQQITKAMKLVSTVKLQKAKGRAEQANPYFEHMYRTVSSILSRSANIDHPYLRNGGSDRKAVVVLTANRGLAGGYNSNIVRLVTDQFSREDTDVYAVGEKGLEVLQRKGYHIAANASEMMDAPTYPDATALCERVLSDFSEGKIGEIYLAYTHFKNTVSHEAKVIRMLPVDITAQEESGAAALMNYEPNEQEALNEIIPKYVTSLFYGALVEASASENGARMQAMDSATSNAQDMIEDLSLQYNRARQGSITQELTEIIAGANAIQ